MPPNTQSQIIHAHAVIVANIDRVVVGVGAGAGTNHVLARLYISEYEGGLTFRRPLVLSHVAALVCVLDSGSLRCFLCPILDCHEVWDCVRLTQS